ncbi:dihydrodipicolinate synthase family protein [Paucibacter sp. XJ19-41]|uniref:dihydrodipicolinate synthase family protein n=1 Tax=Paucibacter sp. XJ19-41 TaxID=2927824 RepID=UPI00234A397B|nr:dihydrodipicolinate synthase family protein [Paucibacter sp. XJ19-41]MDC6169053.1 dihydrodipicolinate synthase family protein [Paucibacter sp. XJ19-41]
MVNDVLTGAFAPVVTPFLSDGRPDVDRFIAHCRWLLAQGAGLAPFGTNSEANSMSALERMALLDALIDAGLPPARMLPGTGACSAPEAAQLSRHAVQRGCAGVLMLPPFFYKGISDDGLYAFYAEVIARIADPRLRLYLYHIPALSGVPISHGVIERLLRDFPGIVVGIKDSSGDWDNLRTMLERFPELAIFPASESFISRTRPLGARGCISATVNINPGPISRLVTQWDGPEGQVLQAGVDRVRQIAQARPMIAALKEVLAEGLGEPGWRRVRAPLVGLAPEAAQALHAELAEAGFKL